MMIFIARLLTSIFASLIVSLSARPNIILFMVDDMGYGDAGFNGQTMFTTPNLDKMADEGMRFTDFYAAATVCAPSRGSLMQGLHTGHGRIKGNDATYLKDTDVTITDIMKYAGYNTGNIGKWGIGEFSPADNPSVHGVDYFYGYVWNWHAHNFYPEFIFRNGERVPLNNVCSRNCGDPGTTTEGRGVAEIEHNDYVPAYLSAEAEKFIVDNYQKEEPFFLIYTPNIPHTNNEGGWDGHGQEVPDYGEFATKGWPKVEQGFAQMMRYIDNDVGMMMNLLDSLGIDNNTLMIFTSDNGPHQEGGHSMTFFNSNGELRGMKRDLWDGGIRVPMLARWPGVIEANSTTDYIGYSPDFMPTFAALAGVSTPIPIDGYNILPTLLGNSNEQEQHEYLYWEFYGNAAIRSDNWKLVGDALYSLEGDIGEQNDVSASNSSTVTQLKSFVAEAHENTPITVSWNKQKISPAIIVGCMDDKYVEYDSTANVENAAACKTLLVGIDGRKQELISKIKFNPLKQVLNVYSSSAYNLKVRDLKGHLLWQQSGEGNRAIDLKGVLSSGLYVIQLKEGDFEHVESHLMIFD